MGMHKVQHVIKGTLRAQAFTKANGPLLRYANLQTSLSALLLFLVKQKVQTIFLNISGGVYWRQFTFGCELSHETTVLEHSLTTAFCMMLEQLHVLVTPDVYWYL